MAQDKIQPEPDGYYDEDAVNDDEIDLSFLDKDDDQADK